MLTSFLIPTRGRCYNLKNVIKSIINKSSKENQFEILFKIDDDDNETFEEVKILKEKYLGIIKYIKFSRMNGYNDIHFFINKLCEISNGDWLFIFNDDCFIISENWDSVVKKEGGDGLKVIKVLEPRDINGRPNTFPIISRKMYEIMGHFSECIYADGWVAELGKKLGILKDVEIIIDHSSKYDRNTGMQHNINMRDKTFEESFTAREEGPDNWKKTKYIREEDYEKLRKYLNNNVQS